MLVVPIGGGGLIGGIATAAKALRPDIRIIGVEAALYPSTFRRLQGLPMTGGGPTLAEGIAGGDLYPVTMSVQVAGLQLLASQDGLTLDGEIVAGAVVPGGAANKIPTAVAGGKVDDAGLDQMRVIAPPKGTGIRYYVRGSQFVVRLKGAQKDFAGEFFVEGDDGAPPNCTAIRMALDPTSGKLGVKIRDASGAYLQVSQGAAVLSSANGENKIEVTDEGVSIMGKVITLAGDQLTDIHGGAVLLNMPSGVPPVPGVSSVAQGAGAPLNTFSATVHVGP